MIDSVERGAKIQQNKKSFVSPVDHRQQVIEYAKKGGVSAMATSIRRLKLGVQIVCVYMCLQLIGNCSLEDLGHVR